MRRGAIRVAGALFLVTGLGIAVTSAQENRQENRTRVGDIVPKFDMAYFAGNWAFEWTAPDSPLGEGGPIQGTERIRPVLDGRYYELSITGEGPEGPITGSGVLFYLDTPSGQHLTRYEVARGISLLKFGALGGDLGGAYNFFWETPPFQRGNATVRLRGRSYLTSPAAYKVVMEIAVDGEGYQSFGTILYTKQAADRTPPPPRYER